MQNNISLCKLFIAFFALFTLGVGEVKAWQIKANQTVYYFEYNSWGAVNFHVWGSDWSNNHTMTQIGSTPYYYYTQGGSDYNSISGFLFQKAKNDGTNKTSDLGYDVTDHTVFVDNTKYGGMKRATTSTTLYFDNTIFGYSTIYFRSGGSGFSIANVMTKVPGTANLYKVSVPQYLPFDAYCFANNCAYTGKNSVYTVDVADNTYDVTKSTVHVKSDITGELTYCYSSDGDLTDGCQYYNFSTFSGHTRRVTISDYSHGTVTAAYTDEDNSAKEKTSGSFDVAHTCNVTITAVPATGYNLSSLTVGGDAFTSGNTKIIDATTTIAAVFSAKTTTITLDYSTSAAGYGTSGSQNSVTGTYDSAMPTITVSNLPKGATGWAFTGYYDSEGVKYYNADGTSAKTWDKEDAAITLYARYQKAEITSLSFNPITTGTHQKVVVTPTVAPTPEGTIYTCWKLFYDNECTRELDTVTFHSNPSTGVNDVYFYTPGATGAYYIRAILRTSNSCESAGLDTIVRQYAVASEHTVTVQYKCGDISIHTPSTVTIEAGGTKGVNAYTGDDVFGYQFTNWTISDDSGVTIEEGELTDADITISAIMNGTIIANYSKKKYVYLDASQTFGSDLWTNPYAYLYNSSGYWDNEKGAGATGANCIKKGAMTVVPGEAGLWYFDYSDVEGSFGYKLAFTEGDGMSHANFNGKEGIYRTDMNAGTPMFVPVVGQSKETKSWSGGSNDYYSKGYWRAYEPSTGKTGYTLKVYDRIADSGRKEMRSRAFTETSVEGKIFEAIVDLEANTTYGIKFIRDNDQNYTNVGQTMSNGSTMTFAIQPSSYAAVSLTTNVAGDYIFTMACTTSGELTLHIDFPAAVGDYRVVYTDNATWTQENGTHSASWIHPSRTITKRDDGRDTVSFYINKDASPRIKIQSISGVNPVSWTNVTEFVNIPDTIKSKGTGVYNFILKQEGGSISIEKIEPYIGNYYIRVDCAGSTKWSDYKATDHMMTYSDYAANKTGSDYTHYYMKFVRADGDYKNVKFVIANDYSPCISDTLIRQTSDETPNHVDASGNLQVNANIRFMWNSRTNSLKRAYLAEGQNSGSHFLVLQGQETYIYYREGNNVRLISSNNNGVEDDAIQFTDNQNWVYEATVKAKPNGRMKLYAKYDEVDYYFYGDSESSFDDPHGVELISGSGENPELIRVLYDFKTDRLIAAWMPTDAEISTVQTINADIMLVRKHQESGQQVNLLGTGKITTNKKVYAVMQFNKYELNNLEKTGSHNPLSPGDQKSSFERHNYFISFPFDVKLGEIFGFGQVGVHWRIMYYDGLGRAQEGFFAERTTNWFMIDDTDSILHANQGYMLQLSPSAVSASNGTTWANNLEQIELYFPSMNTISSIELKNETIPALGEEYKCTKDLSSLYDGNQEANRTIKDSYWRCIGVPGFTSYEANAGTWTNFDWRTDGLPYIYEWVKTDNSLRVISSNTFTFQPMHAYLVQNKNAIIWTSVAKPVAAIVARKGLGTNETYEFRLEINQSTTLHDQTYIRLTNQDGVTANFDFGQDLSKELNSGKTNIYTFIGYEKAAANSLSLSNQTTQVAVGVQIAEDGNYTFAIPDGTNGIGVTLIDNETGTRTNLSAIDYNVNLSAGTYDNRFTLEISAVDQTPTNIEESTSEEAKTIGTRKLLIDGVLYIVRDGNIYDARGVRIE